MSRPWDVVVVGAGHNGLTAAALLARQGRRVLVVERRDLVGGLGAGEEFHPGFRTAGLLHETAAVRPWVVERLELGKFGLELASEPAPVFVPQLDGPGLLLRYGADAAAEEIAVHSAADAGRYREYRDFLARIRPVVLRLLDRPPPDLLAPGPADLWSLGRTALKLRLLGRKEMMELLRIVPMCAADWLGEWFEGALLRAALAAPAIYHTFAGPWSPGSNANLLLGEAAAARPVHGGPRALVRALERAARQAGVEIRTGEAVTRIELAAGAVSGVALQGGEIVEARAVAAACDPKHLFLDLLPPAHLTHRLEHDIRHFRARGTTAKVHLALDGLPRFACRPELTAPRVRIGESLDELERAFDAVKYRGFSERPILDLYLPTLEAPELAPEGRHVASILVHFAAHDLDGGWGDGARAGLYRAVLSTLERYAPGIGDRVLGSETLSPRDLEARYGLSGGHPHHGEHALDQLLVRPAPECTGYRTPFGGLYLCGAGSHPGGGITCAPGALAARAILAG